MATADKKATTISNRDSTPLVLTNARISGARMIEAVGTLEAETTDDAGSTYRICSVPSHARVSEVLLSCDGGGTVGAVDVGVYETTDNGGAAKDADLFASAQSIVSALTNEDVTHESGVFGIEDIEQTLWEALGESEDPKKDYDLVLTSTTAPDADQTVTAKIRYVD